MKRAGIAGRMRHVAAVSVLSVAAALAMPGLADAQFYWPWQQRPAPPPPPPPPAQPARPRPAAPRPATPKPPEPSKAEAEQPEPPPPPYEPKLLRLSEILGALAFLRPLCGGNDETEWRGRMTQLIDAEASTTGRRERLAGAYNKGYREYALTYRRCTPAAEVAITRFVDEGGKLARELASRYGG
ncbi:TIGR02301 family protein [Alsobacter sp. R-9]